MGDDRFSAPSPFDSLTDARAWREEKRNAVRGGFWVAPRIAEAAAKAEAKQVEIDPTSIQAVSPPMGFETLRFRDSFGSRVVFRLWCGRWMYIKVRATHNWLVSNISVADARNNFSGVIARARGEAVFIERRGQRAAVVISPDRYERMLEALEGAEDAAAFDKAMAEEGSNFPWAQVKVDLGWL